MNPEFGDIRPPAAEPPKMSAEHLLWDERLREAPPPAGLASRALDALLLVAGIAGSFLALGVAIYGLISLFW